MARQHERTQANADRVKTLAGLGLTHPTIAVIVGCSVNELNTYYRDEYEQGIAVGNVSIARSAFDQAVGRPAEYDATTGKQLRAEMPPDKSVTIFLCKARLGMRETQRIEHTGADGAPIATSEFDLSALNDEEFELLEKLRRKAQRRQAEAEAEGRARVPAGPAEDDRQNPERGAVAPPAKPGRRARAPSGA